MKLKVEEISKTDKHIEKDGEESDIEIYKAVLYGTTDDDLRVVIRQVDTPIDLGIGDIIELKVTEKQSKL